MLVEEREKEELIMKRRGRKTGLCWVFFLFFWFGFCVF